jgi:hypothetical protein
VNVTNYVTVINFAINVESLTSQLLTTVLTNERPDLEIAFTENSEEISKAITQLKMVQNTLLGQLDQGAKALLGGETLIQTLNESQ